MISHYILYILVAVVIIQFTYLLCFLSFLFHQRTSKRPPTNLPVSVIICAKNEVENIRLLVPKLLDQDYSEYQIVLINDASSDETLEVMKAFQKQHAKIKVVDVENNEFFWGNKKYALTLGIKAAKYDHLLFTDADCTPVSNQWIRLMSESFSDQKTIVLGYGSYHIKKNSFLNLLVRYETILTAIQYFSYAKLGSPYMAVGRNLAYTRDEFYRVKGFISHMRVRSGDDDLFIRDAATATNIAIVTDPKSFTISQPPQSFSEWIRQKRRHISTAIHYKKKHQFLLSLFFISKLFFWLFSTIALFFLSVSQILILIGSYVLLNHLVISFSAKKLHEHQVVYFQPFLEIFLILFQITIFIANSVSKPTHWK